MKIFLLCDSPEHAEVVDQLIMERLRDVDGNKGAQWSGVYTDGTRYGVLWASPASELFGNPEEDPSLQLATEVITDGVSDWGQLEAPEPEVQPQ